MASVPAKTTRQAIDEHAPWRPPSYEPEDVVAIQALAKGTANLEQQRRALAWIIERAAGAYEMSYRPGGEDGARDTTFAEGRRFVGNQLVKMIKLKVGQLK